MCGRYRLTQAERFAEMSDVRLTWKPRPRDNIAPTQKVAVVLDEELGVFFPEIRWGLIPSWAKDAKIGAEGDVCPVLLPAWNRLCMGEIGALRSENRNGTVRRMSTKMIEQELADLKQRVEKLEKTGSPTREVKPKGSWRDVIGWEEDDELFREAVRLGAEWRARANAEGR